jgi:hypothetical protein
MRDFYLAGGTALALRFAHRISIDLDFFSDCNPLGFPQRQELRKAFESLHATLEEEKDGTLHFLMQKTHLSFFRYSYRLLRPPRLWGGLRVADPLDIGLMKIGAIMGRGSKKDFVDLYFILQAGVRLPQLMRAARKKFPDVHDFALQASRALVYFQDADSEPPLRMLKPVAWAAIKAFFEQEVRKIVQPFVRDA